MSANGDNYQYSNQVLSVYYAKPESRMICEKGIFYPNIFDDNYADDTKIKIRLLDTEPDTKRKKDSDSTKKTLRKPFYGTTRMDSLAITNFEELKFLDTTPQKKRFRFWLFRKGEFNPTVCFLELTNEKATSTTDMMTFINGATLTFFKAGWLII